MSLTTTEEVAHLESVCERLADFQDAISYPDSVGPASGDTWRAPYQERVHTTWSPPEAASLFAGSGYGAARAPGLASQQVPPFQVDLLNSSLSLTHEHGDFLSLTMWANGWEWLIDPGFRSHKQVLLAEFASAPRAHTTFLPCGRTWEPLIDEAARLASVRQRLKARVHAL